MMVDQASGFDPNAPIPKREPPKLDDATNALLSVADTAEAWWKGRRPAHWRLRQHLANPTINTSGLRERALAEAVAEWKRQGG